ncbi:MAG: hypothetical protein KTR22_08760 [Flavobacteriaceae bacterium]|nr:hypothetical protein [Flavobacteriaceae bacterium]
MNKRSLGYNRRSHDLLYLYNSLDDESKKLIEQSFIIKSHFRTIQPYDKALSLFQNWFQEKLRKCSNGFIEWRYPYEFIERNGEIESDYGFLLKVTDMLEDYGLRLERGEL